jgi:uncharacterized protein YajQ (UPF0234 family)
MPSFDIVVQSDVQEVDNAVNQASKELAQRYDFRGSKSRIEWDKEGEIVLYGDDDWKLSALADIVKTKLLRRKVSIKNLEITEPEDAGGALRRQRITLQQGVPTETAKEIVKRIKQTKLKVQSQIQDDQVRVTGKKRDDLQSIVALVREADLGFDFQFVNFRD